MIRWKGVIFLAVVVGIFVALSLIFTDRWLENRLEKAGSQIVGARVDIDGLDFSFTGAHLRWKRLQVTDPGHTMRNLFETGKCELNFEFWPLLSKKIIIENFEISDLRTNTPRKTDGKLPVKPKKKSGAPDFFQKATAKLMKNVEKNTHLPLGAFHKKVNTDSLLKILQLQSPHKIDSLQKALVANYQKWQTDIKGMQWDKDVQRIKLQIQSIDPNKIKDLKSLQKALKTVRKVKKEIDALNDSLKQTKSALTADLNAMKASLQQADEWIKQDYRHALSIARIPEISKKNIARMLFGPTIVNRFTQYLSYIRTLRYYSTKLKSQEPKKEKPPRFKGQDIYFYSPNARPDFWIKKILLSGQTATHLQLKGRVTDIVSDQRFIQRPTKIEISGQSKDGQSFSLKGTLNYLGPKPQETFALSYLHFPLNNTKLGDSPYLPQKLRKGIGNLKASLSLKGDYIDGVIDFFVTQMAFQTSNEANVNKNVVRRLILETVQSIKTLTVRAHIQGTGDRLKFNLNSNLDDLLVRRLKSKLSGEIEKARAKIKSEIDRRVQPKRKELEALIAQNQAALQKEIGRYQTLLNQEQNRLKKQQKELEAKIAREKSKASKKVQQKLKSLFK